MFPLDFYERVHKNTSPRPQPQDGEWMLIGGA
jgi:hypothetical protein